MTPAPIPDCIETPAVIQDEATAIRYVIRADELMWRKSVNLDPKHAGYLYLHYGELDHPELGSVIFYAWEGTNNIITFDVARINSGIDSVKGIDSIVGFDSIGHIKIVENFTTYSPYTSYKYEGEDESTSEDKIVEMMNDWFFSNYEDPVHRLPYISAEGGYQWIWGGPYDAREQIGDNFSEFPEHLIEKAVGVVEVEGTHEWSPVSKPEDYEDFEDDGENAGERVSEIPDQTPHFAFIVNDAGQIDLAPDSGLPADEDGNIRELKQQLVEALDESSEKLTGSNAHPEIAGYTARYREAVVADPLSVDILYAKGLWFENIIRRVKQDIAAGEPPPLAPDIKAALDTVLKLHGIIIASTKRGQELIRLANEYEASNVDNQAYRTAAQPLIEAVGQSTNIFTAETINFVSQANSEIEEGEHPQRSSHVGRATLSNFLVTIGKIVVGEVKKIIASGVRQGLTDLVAAGVFVGMPVAGLATLRFFVDNMGALHALTLVARDELLWLSHLLHWITPFL
ncbi:MAG: hypothetical protein ACYYKD_08215 [Rhodospirillales bacterium]